MRKKGMSALCASWLLLMASLASAQVVPDSARDEGAIDDGDARVIGALLIDATQLKPGDTARVGVRLELDPRWHLYWRNSGEAGLPTEIDWEVSAGATVGPMGWPAPSTFIEGDGAITTYGYGDEVTHVSALTVPSAVTEDSVTIRATVNFLTCAEICIPGELSLERALKLGDQTVRDEVVAALMDEAQRLEPREAPDAVTIKLALDPAQLVPSGVVEATAEVLTCPRAEDCPPLKPAGQLAHLFVPEASDNITWKPVKVEAHPSAPGYLVQLRGEVLSKPKAGAADRLAGVVSLVGEDGVKRAFSASIPALIREADAARAAPQAQGAAVAASATGRAEGAAAPAAAVEMSLIYLLLLAFLGGITLNAMPCVFPVLTLKLGALANLANEDRRVMIKHGLAYTAGIISTMIALALVVIALKVTGEEVGWGFQFQNPWFLVALCAVLVGFAVNLMGVFEVTLPMGGRLAALTGGESGLGRSYAEGLLCVLLATPCSAPFMGTAVGFALAGSAFDILAIFSVLGLGLASPFLLLTALPGWRRLLPRPGDWLTHLKHFLALSLLGTSIWLVWLIGASYGADSMARVLVFLLALAVGAWLYGMVQFGAGTKRVVVSVLALATIVVTGWLTLRFEPPSETRELAQDSGQGWAWEVFDEGAVQAKLTAGKPVFVDFTASWCVTCKVNERGALASDEVAAAVRAHEVVMFKADWTLRDDRIRDILRRHGKAGVPMYLVYSPSHPNDPVVLPELLTSAMVVEALAAAASGD